MTSALDRLQERARRSRVPLNGTLELTWRCNLRCAHCYQDGLRGQHRELSTSDWKALIDQAAGLGCLQLTFTGGEPLVREDFAELYRYAHRRGFLITLFTNGTLLGPERVELLRAAPPRRIEISLYGTSSERYREVTGSPAAYEQLRAGLERLSGSGLAVTLKTVALRQLAGELPQMRALAEEHGFSFRWDSVVTPRLDGGEAPLEHRLEEQEAVALDARHPERVEALCSERLARDEQVVPCGAGRTAFHLDPEGTMRGCVLLREPCAPASELGFGPAWEALAPLTRQVASALPGTCGSCPHVRFCSACPGICMLEGGDLEAAVGYHCCLTKHRMAVLGTG